MEAQHKLNGLGLPRQWKVITSTLLLLFTFAIGNVLGADDVYYVMLYNNITDAGVLTSSSTLNYGIVKYSASTGKYASSTEITVEGMGTSKASKYSQANISTFSTVGNWVAGSGTAYAAGGKFTALTIKLGTKTASSIKFIGYRNTSSTGEMTISETAKATAKKPSTYGNDCLLEWTGNFTGDVSVSVKDNKEHVGVFVITVPEAKYSVTYKAGDGTGDDVVDGDAKTVKAFADCSFTAPSGYEFKEWQDGSSNVVAAGATVSADMTLTAIYRLIPTKYTITYDLNGASGDAPTETDKAAGDVFNLAVAPSWAGHAFDGWLCSADAAVKAAGSSYTMTAANTTFTAQWHEVDCKIYSLTGGIGSAVVQQANATVNDGVSLILSNSDGIIKLSPASGSFNEGDIVTISGTVGNTTKEFGVKISNAADKKATLGTASVAGTTNPMVATATLSAASDYLYICRTGGTTQTILTCEVHRACAEGTAAGLSYAETEVNKTESDDAFTNPLTNANSLVLDGYKSSNEEVATVNFSTGEVTIVGAGSATITANSAIQTKAGTLYAAGTASYTLTVAALPKYHVTYDLNGGSGEVAEVDHKAGEKFTLHDGVTGVTAPGSKTFVNWKDQDDALFDGGVEYTMPAKDVTLTAQWAGDVYTVKFMDGETVLDTKVVEVGSHPADIEHPTKPLYTFAAWQLSGSDVILDEVSGAKDAVVTLTARWTKIYATSYDMEAYAASAGADKDGLEGELTAAGYAFTNVNGIDNGHTHNYIYDGMKYKTNDGDLSFNVNAGKLVIVKTGNLPANALTMYINGVADPTIFVGANEAVETHVNNYFYSAVEALYRLDIQASKGTCAIKAVTITNPFTVSFEAHGDADPADMQGTPSVTLPTPTNGSASFLGWFDAETGGNKIGEAGASYTPTANITLHAQWEAISTDARLASITFSSDAGTLEPAFDPEVTSYTYTMPYGTAAVPTITGATKANPAAKDPVIDAQAAAWGETAHVHGVAASDDTKDYYVQMLRAPKDGISIIKVATTGGTNKTVTGLYAGDGDVNLSNSTKMDNGKYIGFILDGTTLQAGDQINVHTTTAANTGGSHIIFYDNMTDKNELYETGEIGGLGDNIFTINAAMEGKATAYVYRSNADVAHQWNGYVDFIEVTRAMNPILKAITINSRAGEIDALNDHHFSVLIPYDADLAALTIVPTIFRNAPHATTPEAVISNAGDWIEGDNTYRVMDKDGDYTDYTITLTRDVLKHTVSFNTHGGSTIDPVQVVDGQKLAAAPADPTKDDYIFQGWAETEDGAEVDITTVQINADKTFHAVWEAEPAGIKLINGDVVNHTNFLTGTNETTVEIESVEHKCVDFTTAGSNRTTVASIADLKEFIQYNATTNKAKIKLTLYNTRSSAVSAYLHMLEEGSETPTTEEISIPAGEVLKTDFYEFNSEKNRSFYITCGNRNYIKVLQVKVIDDGTTTLKKAGQVGYSVNTLKSRIFAPQQSAISFEGLTINANAVCKPLSTTALKIKNAYNISFHADAAMTLAVTTEGSQTYYVSTTADGTANETSFTGRKEFNITAGDWYIHAGGSELRVAKLEFSLPKAEEPTITTQPASNHTFGPGNLTAMVVAEVSDGGTLSYQWYDASDDSEVDGATSATLTTTTEGTYYVIVTNSLAGHQNSSIKSDEATLAYRDASDATLSALSVSNGTLAPTFDPAELNYRVDLPEGTVDVPTLTATATMAGFADVVIFNEGSFTNYEAVSTVTVTSEDLSDTKVYTVHFYVAHAIATLVDVTENTTWDWSLVTKKKDGTIISGDGPIVTEAVDGPVIANYLLGENFDKVEGNNGAYAIRSDSRKVYQGASLHIHTTKGGYLSIWAANEGTTQTLNVANEGRDMRLATLTGSQVEYKVYVNAGDVVIYNIPETSGKPMRVSKMIFTVDETPDYTRDQMLGNGVYGTICVPYNVPAGGIHGITVYELMGRESQYGKMAFDEIIEMEAGVPYVFQAHGDELALFYGETSVAAPVDKDNGMYGTFTDQVLTELNDVYYFAQKALWSCADLNSLDVPANRAYVKLSEVGPVADPNPAPGRRRISMVVNGEQIATGFENVQGDNVQCTKVLINGQLFILRGEKMYDAKGQLVK